MILSANHQKIGATPLTQRRLSLDRLCRTLIFHRLKNIPESIRIRDPWGDSKFGLGDAVAQLQVIDPKFYRNALRLGSLGVAGSWINHGWETSDLTTLLRIFARNTEVTDRFGRGFSWLASLLALHRHQRRANTLAGSKKNIHDHYDLGNDFFALILDDTMTYSAGLFETQKTTLKEASIAKLDRICQMLELQPEDHVIEIGCGWGSFAIHAAQHYGCRITGVTISPEQYRLATQRVADAGLTGQIEFQLCDYRHVNGQYDKLASIEMIEAVGHSYLPLFFRKCSSLLLPGGKMTLQAITLPNERYDQYLHGSDFIQQYIFPGGCLLSHDTIEKHIVEHTDLIINDIKDIGIHYAETLRHWRKNFWEHEKEIRSLGCSEDFIRIWHYYFCYCEAGFEELYLGDLQILLTKS